MEQGLYAILYGTCIPNPLLLFLLPLHIFFPQVLKQKRGLPITMSIVYHSVARRLGVTLLPVSVQLPDARVVLCCVCTVGGSGAVLCVLWVGVVLCCVCTVGGCGALLCVLWVGVVLCCVYCGWEWCCVVCTVGGSGAVLCVLWVGVVLCCGWEWCCIVCTVGGCGAVLCVLWVGVAVDGTVVHVYMCMGGWT